MHLFKGKQTEEAIYVKKKIKATLLQGSRGNLLTIFHLGSVKYM